MGDGEGDYAPYQPCTRSIVEACVLFSIVDHKILFADHMQVFLSNFYKENCGCKYDGLYF